MDKAKAFKITHSNNKSKIPLQKKKTKAIFQMQI